MSSSSEEAEKWEGKRAWRRARAAGKSIPVVVVEGGGGGEDEESSLEEVEEEVGERKERTREETSCGWVKAR